MDFIREFVKLLQYCFNKFFYSWLLPIISIILSYTIYKTLEFNILLIILINIIIIIYWLYKLIYIPKNKTEKYGIIFLINNGEFYNNNIYSMFNKIKYELQDNFEIFIFNNNFMRRINNEQKSKNTIFKKNYHMIINLFSMSAKEDNENVCSLTNKNITFLTPTQNMNENIIRNLERDFTFGFKKILKLSEKNSYIDINENADIMSLSIRYFVSIIYIIFNEINKAEQQLNMINFSASDNKDKIVQYIRKSCVRRYAEIYYVKINRNLDTYKYLYEKEDFNNLNELVIKLGGYIDSDPSLTELRYFLNDFKSKVFFAKGDYSSALYCLERMQKKYPNDYGMLLSKAFIELNLNDTRGFEIYKKLSKKDDLNIIIIKGCINFIDNSLKNNIHNKGNLLLCKGILIYYWDNKKEGIRIINNSLKIIDNINIIKYVKVRFKLD